MTLDDPNQILEEAMRTFTPQVIRWALQIENGFSTEDLEDIAAYVFTVLGELLDTDIERVLPAGVTGGGQHGDNPHLFRDEPQMAAYLQTTTQNQANNLRRKLSNRRRREELFGDPGRISAPLEPDPGELLASSDTEQFIADACQALPDEQRTALALYMYGLTREQAAAEMQIGAGRYRGLVKKAQKTIEKRLECWERDR